MSKRELKNNRNRPMGILIAVLCMAFCSVFFVSNLNHAVAIEQDARCNIQEHVHVDSCYNGDVIECGCIAHSHDKNCYLVLLEDNNINEILTLAGNNEDRSLESVINSTVTTALVYNDNLNTPEGNQTTLNQDTVSLLNKTISDEESLPDLVLNENINTLGSTNAIMNSSTVLVEDVVSSNNVANYYIYLDGKWTCIGQTSFNLVKRQYSSNRYDCIANTNDILELVNSKLGTSYTYTSFDVSVSSTQNGTYAKDATNVGQTSTYLVSNQRESQGKTAKHVRLIPNGNSNANSTSFAFYTVKFEYPDGRVDTRYVYNGTSVEMPAGNYIWVSGTYEYNPGDTVSINKTMTFTAETVGPVEFINVTYNVNFPSVSGVTVNTKPTIAGTSVNTITDGFDLDSSATIRNVSNQEVEGKVNNNGTGLSRVVHFKGWQVGNTNTIIRPNTNLVWDELVSYANKNTLTLTGVWDYDAKQTASFFIRFDSVAVDTNGNITGQDSNKYTKELFASYVGGIDTSQSVSTLQNKYYIADTTSDNSFGADQKIRALYGEKADQAWLYQFPQDDYIFQQLVQYAQTGYLSVDGDPVKVEDLNSEAYAIRWYVFKCQDDAWHIDGKLVKKEGLIHVYKKFAGNMDLINEAKANFYIEAISSKDMEKKHLDLSNYKAFNSETETYMWEITDVAYGEEWTIKEYNGLGENPDNANVYSSYSIVDARGNQSRVGEGNTTVVIGTTYALDEGVSEVLKVEFTNIYNRTDSIVIKKQDGATGQSIGGAEFQMIQNGKVLKFTYDSAKKIYRYDPGGKETILKDKESGYFEISIQNFSYDNGPITVKETKAPEGYIPIGDIQIGHIDKDKHIGILSGNSELIKYVNGVLLVGNSTEASSVTVKKQWECPESEWRDVKLQLMANGKLVTTVISGVAPEVTLNSSNDWKHTWANLPLYVNGEKIVWSVREIQIGQESCKSDGTFVNWIVAYEIPIKSVDQNGNENTLLTVTNTTKRVMLRLTKTDIDRVVQLKGATFMLETVDANGNVISSEISKTATTGDTGTLIFDNLKCGVRYRLTELIAPVGYYRLDEYIYFTINEDGTVSVEDHSYAEAGTTAYNILVTNQKAIPLPEAGGQGITTLYLMGAAMMILSMSLYKKTKH